MKLSEVLDADASTEGYLEWLSGLLFVRRTLADWQAILRDGPPLDARLVQLKRTLLHETFHFYQIVCTGWLYSFVVHLQDHFRATLRGEGRSAEQTLQRLVAGEPVTLSPGLLEAAAALDAPGEGGLTIRGLVESAALLHEFRAEYLDCGPRSFAEQRRIENPPEEYTAAYDQLSRQVGEDGAFDWLLLLSGLALCFADPTSAFAAASRDLPEPPTDPDGMLEQMRAIAGRVSKEVEPLGSGAEVAERRDRDRLSQHGVYYAAMLEVNGRADTTPPLLLLSEPSILTQKPDELLRPIALRGNALWVPEGAPKLREAAQNQRIIAGVVILLNNQLHLPRPRSAAD